MKLFVVNLTTRPCEWHNIDVVGIFDNIADAMLLKEYIDSEIQQGGEVINKWHESGIESLVGSKEELLENLYLLHAETNIEEIELNRHMYLQKLPEICKADI